MITRSQDFVKLASKFLKYFSEKKCRIPQDDFIKNFKRYTLEQPSLVEWMEAFNQCVNNNQVALVVHSVILQAYQDYLLVCACFDRQQVNINAFGKELIERPLEAGGFYCCDLGFFHQKITMAILQPEKAATLPILNGSCYSTFYKKNPEHFVYFPDNNLLTQFVSNSRAALAIGLIDAGCDVNRYSIRYGNNALLLSVSKGWNHVETGEYLHKNISSTQKEIIKRLFQVSHLNVNAMHLVNGMSPLHIACMRGDDPAFIELLISRGANPHAKDFLNKTPADYLDETYENLIRDISHLTGNYLFDLNVKNELEHELNTATLPTREERNDNVSVIKALLMSVSNAESSQHKTFYKRN